MHRDAVAAGSAVYLRPVRVSDATARYRDWLNDPEVNRYLEARFAVHTVGSVAEYIQGLENNPDYAFLAVVAIDGDAHIGNVKIGPINRRHGFAELGIMIGDRAFWGRGIGTEALELAARYAFGALRLRRLTAGVYADNRGSLRAFEKAGWTVEGVRRKHRLSGDKYVDEYVLGLTNPARGAEA